MRRKKEINKENRDYKKKGIKDSYFLLGNSKKRKCACYFAMRLNVIGQSPKFNKFKNNFSDGNNRKIFRNLKQNKKIKTKNLRFRQKKTDVFSLNLN